MAMTLYQLAKEPGKAAASQKSDGEVLSKASADSALIGRSLALETSRGSQSSLTRSSPYPRQRSFALW